MNLFLEMSIYHICISPHLQLLVHQGTTVSPRIQNILQPSAVCTSLSGSGLAGTEDLVDSVPVTAHRYTRDDIYFMRGL